MRAELVAIFGRNHPTFFLLNGVGLESFGRIATFQPNNLRFLNELATLTVATTTTK